MSTRGLFYICDRCGGPMSADWYHGSEWDVVEKCLSCGCMLCFSKEMAEPPKCEDMSARVLMLAPDRYRTCICSEGYGSGEMWRKDGTVEYHRSIGPVSQQEISRFEAAFSQPDIDQARSHLLVWDESAGKLVVAVGQMPRYLKDWFGGPKGRDRFVKEYKSGKYTPRASCVVEIGDPENGPVMPNVIILDCKDGKPVYGLQTEDQDLIARIYGCQEYAEGSIKDAYRFLSADLGKVLGAGFDFPVSLLEKMKSIANVTEVEDMRVK